MPGRPFSGKQKKKQLQEKRERKAVHTQDPPAKQFVRQRPGIQVEISEGSSQIVQPTFKSAAGRDRYKLEFQHEGKEELEARKERAMQPFQSLTREELECDSNTFYSQAIDFPQRPSWNYKHTLEQLETREQTYFHEYKRKYLERFGKTGFCELNLETWRQLWRVLEMADMLLIIADVRFAALHFNPVLYEYTRDKLNKPTILVLNKCDFVPPHIAVAWKHYFQEKYPELNLCLFSSYPKDEETRAKLGEGKQNRRKRRRAAAIGPFELWKICKKIVEQNDLNIDSWKAKIQSDMDILDSMDLSDDDGPEIESKVPAPADHTPYEHVPYKDGIITIGCVGYPNVGKSSVINALMGHKVVSVSVTPGHTKHFQTIFLTENVRLCDCPGLVFPSVAPRPLQVLAGLYPISQLREIYSTIQYLAERTELTRFLHIQLPSGYDSWSAFLLCDEYAEFKGFKTGRGKRNDPHRAANFILRKVLDGSIMFYLLPSGFSHSEEKWKTHEESRQLLEAQLASLNKTLTRDERLEIELATYNASSRPSRRVTSSEEGVSGSEDEGSLEEDEKQKDSNTASRNPFDLLNSSNEDSD